MGCNTGARATPVWRTSGLRAKRNLKHQEGDVRKARRDKEREDRHKRARAGRRSILVRGDSARPVFTQDIALWVVRPKLIPDCAQAWLK